MYSGSNTGVQRSFSDSTSGIHWGLMVQYTHKMQCHARILRVEYTGAQWCSILTKCSVMLGFYEWNTLGLNGAVYSQNAVLSIVVRMTVTDRESSPYMRTTTDTDPASSEME